MHILFITSYYPSPASPVIGVFFHDQAIALHKAGHQVGVIAAPRLNTTIARLRHDGISKFSATTRESEYVDFPVYRMHWGWFPRPLPPIVMRLTGDAGLRSYEVYCQAHGTPDVIHAQNIFYGGAIAAKIKQRYGVPVVLTEHSTSYMEGLIIFPGQPGIIRQTLRSSDIRLAVSRALADAIQPYALDQSIEIIGNIADTNFFVPAPPPPTVPFTFSIIGTLESRKQHSLLLEAFAKRFKGQAVLLRVGGDGPLREKLERRCRELGIANQVCFLGRLTRDQVREELQRCHALVSCSLVESFGLTLIEAMACGKPVLSTQSGGPADFVTERTGILIPPQDVTALGDGLERMVAEWMRYRPEEIRAAVVSHYSESAYVKRLETFYDQAIHG